jgi:hypothetical protein
MNFGIGISKSFGRRDQASGMATGKSNAQFNPREYTVTKTYQPGKPVYGNITMARDENSFAKAYQPGQPVYGNRATGVSCGPVTRTVTHPDGTKEEMTFSCPEDAANYIVNSHSTPGTDVSAKTLPLPHILEQKENMRRDLSARNIISGRAVWTNISAGSGISTNKTIVTSGTRGGSVNMNSQTSATRTTPNNSFGTMVRMSAREASSGMATGRRQFEPVFMEGQGSVCNPCLISVNNPIYQESNQQGTNPMYENRASVSNPDGADLNSGIEGLTVSLFDIASGNIVAVTKTEKSGDFFFANVPDGAYSVLVYGNIISKKGYDFYMKSKAEMEGSINWSGETAQIILNTESGDESPSMKAGISTSRSNLRTKSLMIIDADTDGDGVFDTFTMLGDGSDGTRSNNTGDASVSRVNKVDAFTIKQSAMKMSSTFASKLGGVAKGIQITGITVSGDGSANVTFSDGSTMDISNAVSVAASGNAKQYNVVIGDLDDDGAADMVLKITKSRSNIQNNRMMTGGSEDNGNEMEGVKIGKSRSNIQNNRMMNPDEGEELGVVKTKTKSNQSNDRLKNPDEIEEAGVVKTKTKSNQSNDRMMAGDNSPDEIWSPRSNRIFYEVVVADLDGDGKPELAAKITKSRSNIQNNRIMFADVDGDGLSEAIINTSRSNIKNLAVGIGDVDGDGMTDLVSGNKLLGGALPGGSVISAALMPGDPIPGIDVKLKRKSATYEKKIDSDISGRYHVIGPDMEPDTYTMMVTTNIYIDDETFVVLGNKDDMDTNEEGGKKTISGIKQTMQTQVMVEAPVKWTVPEPTKAAINNSHSNIKNLMATVNDIEQMLNNDNSGANASAINNSHSNIKNLRAAAMDMDNTLNDLETMEKDAAMNTVKNKMAAMNMQFLALQESLQKAGRQYTTISNVLKTKHDTVKNSIGNIR